ncbi:hypothetical protein OESDEN_07186 [Oesophagostomum dentatum]|uniref:Uncharacterized protein n=1 Tax=Oesophagostomum dentatum TaxID=61180 RepID=A0A0B1TC25_OESDE|nr:hypothetical protein OESDEN_07186 [Oesophagostomum dentatum]
MFDSESPSLTTAATERSLRINGDYEDKQEKLIRDLNAMLEKDGDGSLIELLKGDFLHVSDADFTSYNSPQSQVEAPPRDSLVPGNVQMMNASLVELMNLSLNTSKDIANFKERLVSFRGMMERIFETLRSSGLLLEEVLLKLGSESEEHRQLAEKIRGMKFTYNTCLNQTQEIMDVINETQFSMNDVELKMIAIERSFNEASFRMDLSLHQTSARIFSQTAECNSSQIREAAANDNDIQTQVASQKEEISKLLSLLEQAEKARDSAVSATNELQVKVKGLEGEIAKLSDERKELVSAVQSEEAERKKLLLELQEERCVTDRLKKDQSESRKNEDDLLRKVTEREADIIELQETLAEAKETYEKRTLELKNAVLERERDVNKLQDALEQEHQRKNDENSSLKADLAAAQETSQSLRRDIEKIHNECNLREATIRHLQDQLQTAMANNSRMADVIAELQQETEAKEVASRKNSENAVTVVEVQTASPTPKVKSRDVQTDVTRTALAQMEFDSVAYASQLNALRTAYGELATVICDLVVKDVGTLPSPGDITSIEKSCKELSKFIRHEKKRRERQAIEIAEVTEKIKDLQQKGVLTETALKEVPQVVTSEPVKHSVAPKKYEDPLRQKLYVLTAMAMDLVTELRRLSSANACGNKVIGICVFLVERFSTDSVFVA